MIVCSHCENYNNYLSGHYSVWLERKLKIVQKIFPTTERFATFTTIYVPVTICIVWNIISYYSQSYFSYECQSHIEHCPTISPLCQFVCVLVVFVSVRDIQITCWGGHGPPIDRSITKVCAADVKSRE